MMKNNKLILFFLFMFVFLSSIGFDRYRARTLELALNDVLNMNGSDVLDAHLSVNGLYTFDGVVEKDFKVYKTDIVSLLRYIKAKRRIDYASFMGRCSIKIISAGGINSYLLVGVARNKKIGLVSVYVPLKAGGHIVPDSNEVDTHYFVVPKRIINRIFTTFKRDGASVCGIRDTKGVL